MAQATRTEGRGTDGSGHPNRTAKVIELVGSSSESFEQAVRNALEDAKETTRGITGAEVANMSVRCDEGEITSFKVDLKIAFGIERNA